MVRVVWGVPFARRVHTIRMCSLDARGLGPIQATLLKTSSKLQRPCLRNGASWRAGAGRMRTVDFLSILRAGQLPYWPPAPVLCHSDERDKCHISRSPHDRVTG